VSLPRILGVTLALTLAAVPLLRAAESPQGRMAVRVTDERGEPVAAAAVRIVAEVGVGERLARTGADGWAELDRLAPGIYRLEVDRPGYQWLEMDDLRVAPGDRLVLRLEVAATEADEVVFLSGGPMVPAAGFSAVRPREREWLDALPVPEGTAERILLVDGRPTATTPPRDGTAFETMTDGSVDLTTSVHLGDVAGRVEVRSGAGVAGEPPGSRGSVEGGRRQISGVAGVSQRWERTAALVVLQASSRNQEDRSRFGSSDGGPPVERSAKPEASSSGILVAVDRDVSGSHRLEGRLRGARESVDRLSPTLFVAPGVVPPTVKRDGTLFAADLRAVVTGSTSTMAFRAAADRSEAEQRPDVTRPGQIDVSADGALSGGIGQGVITGPGGLDMADASDESWLLSGQVSWQAGGTTRFSVGGALDRRTSERTSHGAIRERWRGPGALDIFRLDAGRARWSEDAGAILLEVDWRAADAVTATASLRTAPRTIRGEHGDLSFGVGETLEPGLGVAWDFEGSGRSRAWAAWSRRRPGPPVAVRQRLGGFSDGALTVTDGPAAPTSVAVMDNAPPGVDERWVAGVEYEVLNHVAVGAAASIQRTRGGLATFWEPGQPHLLVGAADTIGLDDLRRATDRVELWLRKRRSTGWQLEFLLAWQDRRGNWEARENPLLDPAAGFLDDVVTAASLATGDLSDGRQWSADLNGSWSFDGGPSVGWWLAYRSGVPRSRLGAEDAGLGLDRRVIGDRGGAGTTADLWWLGAQASWTWPLGNGELELCLEARNLLDSDAALSADDRFAVSAEADGESAENPGWGRAHRVVAPPEVRVGVAWSW
jgi:hypothetical protein